MSATRVLLLVLLVFAVVSPGFTQSSDTADVPGAEEYEPEEFSPFVRDLRRAEIVAIGSIPLTLLATRLLYGVGRFTVQSIRSSSVATEYLPELFAPPGYVPLTRTDNAWILAGTATLSLSIALADYLLGRADQGSR